MPASWFIYLWSSGIPARHPLIPTALVRRSELTASTRSPNLRMVSVAGQKVHRLRSAPNYNVTPRICPGRFLATDTIWIVAVSVIASYRILKPLDEAGKEITPEVAYTPGLFRHVVPFDLYFADLAYLTVARNRLGTGLCRGQRRLPHLWVEMPEHIRVYSAYL